MFRHVGKVVAGAFPAVVLARLGLSALGTVVFLAVLVAGVTCWLLGSDARAARASQVLLAWKGNPVKSAADTSGITPLPALSPQRWPWLRRP